MKKDNKGMTLVELMIAITMLALVSTPFLNSFIVSVRNNNKSRNVLRATTVAQNLMEGLEAFSLEDICRQIEGEPSQTMLYLPKGYEAHVEFPNVAGEKSDWSTGKFVGTQSNKYCFGIKGLEEDGLFYDARILLDASGYRYTGNAIENEKAYNERYQLELTTMNEKKDFIFSLPLTEDEKIVGFQGADYNPGYGSLKRTFKIVISSDTNGTKVSASVLYGEGANVVIGPTLEKTVEELDNIYIMYYPNYKSNATDSYDCFEVEVLQEVNMNLCLIKQKYDTPKDEKTANYAASLVVKDAATLGAATEPRVTLKTNIGKYLYDPTMPDRKGAIQCTYVRNGSQVESGKVDEMLGFVNGEPQSLLGESKKVDPMFKTTVQIYPSGTYNATDATTFDNADVLVQLEN